MTSKSISISEDVYNLLSKSKLKNESFSQTILRLLKRQENILELAGAWNKIPESDEAIAIVEQVVKKIRIEDTEKIQII